jgi:hypothetical protein
VQRTRCRESFSGVAASTLTPVAQHALIFPVEHNTVLNLVAFVSDRSKDENDRVWDGPWVRPVSMEEMLADFEHWDERPRKLLEVRLPARARCSNTQVAGAPDHQAAAALGAP